MHLVLRQPTTTLFDITRTANQNQQALHPVHDYTKKEIFRLNMSRTTELFRTTVSDTTEVNNSRIVSKILPSRWAKSFSLLLSLAEEYNTFEYPYTDEQRDVRLQPDPFAQVPVDPNNFESLSLLCSPRHRVRLLQKKTLR